MKTKNVFRILVVSTFVFTLGCTRNDVKKSDMTTFGLKLPENKALMDAGDRVAHIVVNVRGPGIGAPIIWGFDSDCHCPEDINLLPPSVLSLDVPSGNDRLIQLLVVYENETTEAMKFSYGDVIVNLQPGFQTVAVAIANIGSGSTGQEADVIGRFLDADGTGPTGILTTEYQPPIADRPAVEINRGGIYAGWFRGFAIDGVGLRYVIHSENKVIFETIGLANGNPKINGTEIALAGNTKLTKVSVPAHWRMDGDYSSMSFRTESGYDMIVGYFGPGVAAQKACYSSSPSAIAYAYRLPVPTSSPFPSPTPIGWSTSSPSTNVAGIAAGGVAIGSCSGSPLVDYMEIKHEAIGQNRDGIGGFQGAFKVLPAPSASPSNGGSPNAIQTQYNSGHYDLVWEFVPGASVAEGGKVTGATIFKKDLPAGSNGDYDHDGGINRPPCDVAVQQRGYSRFKDVPVSGTGLQIGSLAELDPTLGYGIRVCPYADMAFGRLYFPDSAGYASIYNGGGSGGGGGMPSPTPASLVITQIGTAFNPSGVTTPQSFYQGWCVPVTVEFRDGGSAPIGVGGNISVSSTNGTAQIFSGSDPNCTGGGSNPTGFGVSNQYSGTGQNSYRFYIRDNNSTGAPITISYSGGSPSVSSGAITMYTTPPSASSTSTFSYKLFMPASVFANDCVPFSLEVVDGSGNPAWIPDSGSGNSGGLAFVNTGNWSISGSTGTTGQIYSNAFCSQIGTFEIGLGQRRAVGYLSIGSTPGTITFSTNSLIGSFSPYTPSTTNVVYQNASVSVVANANPLKQLAMLGQGYMTAHDTCYSYSVYGVDAEGHRVLIPPGSISYDITEDTTGGSQPTWGTFWAACPNAPSPPSSLGASVLSYSFGFTPSSGVPVGSLMDMNTMFGTFGTGRRSAVFAVPTIATVPTMPTYTTGGSLDVTGTNFVNMTIASENYKSTIMLRQGPTPQTATAKYNLSGCTITPTSINCTGIGSGSSIGLASGVNVYVDVSNDSGNTWVSSTGFSY